MKGVTPSSELKVITLYEKGVKAKEIRKKVGIGNTTLYRILKRNKIKVKIGKLKKDAPDYKICEQCSKKYKMKYGSFKQFIESKYCSRKCFSNFNKGVKRGIAPRSAFKKGNKPWNKGLDWAEMKGEKHPNYKQRVKTTCATCGKKISLHPYRLKKPENNYCSQRCTVISQHINKKFPTSNSSIERKMRKRLEEEGYKEGVDFFHQYKLGRFVFDFAFPKKKLLIECNGDFWHANPQKYAIMYDKKGKLIEKDLHPIQIKDIKKDKRKEKYALKLGWGFPVIAWESDINHEQNFSVIINDINYKLK